MSLSEKVVLITGASSGIGASTAVHFAKRGSWLALCGRNKDNLAATISSCLENGTPTDKVIILIGDLTTKEVCQKTINDVIDYFGRLDVLVNSAGIQVMGSIVDLAVEDYDRQMDINVRSVFLLTQLAVPHLIKTKGDIVNVSSVAGLRSMESSRKKCKQNRWKLWRMKKKLMSPEAYLRICGCDMGSNETSLQTSCNPENYKGPSCHSKTCKKKQKRNTCLDQCDNENKQDFPSGMFCGVKSLEVGNESEDNRTEMEEETFYCNENSVIDDENNMCEEINSYENSITGSEENNCENVENVSDGNSLISVEINHDEASLIDDDENNSDSERN